MNYVYLLSSGKNGTLYLGVTNNLIARVAEHIGKQMKDFQKNIPLINWVVQMKCLMMIMNSGDWLPARSIRE